MKKIISMVTMICILLGMTSLPIYASAASDDDFKYIFDFESEDAIGQSSGAAGVVTLDDGDVINNVLSIRGTHGSCPNGCAINCWHGLGAWHPWSWAGHPDLFGKTALSFDIMVPSTSGIGAPQMMTYTITGANTNAGIETMRMMYLEIKESSCRLLFLGAGRSDYLGPTFARDEWMHVEFVIDPVAGTHTVFVGDDVVTYKTPDGSGNAVTSSYGSFATLTFLNHVMDSEFYMDNIKMVRRYDMALTESAPAEGDAAALPMAPISLSFINPAKTFELSLNGTPIITDEWVNTAGNTYEYNAPSALDWGTDYTLSGTVTDIYGSECDVNFSFSTDTQPANTVEIVGFYNASEDKLAALESGSITAKFRFWQTAESEYTYLMALYKDNNGAPELVDIVADVVTTDVNKTTKSLTLTVPDDFSDGFISVFACNNLTDLAPYTKDMRYGDTILR